MEKRALPEFLHVPWGVRDVVLFLAAFVGLQIIFALALGLGSYLVPDVRDFLRAAVDGDVGASFALNTISWSLGIGLLAVFIKRHKVKWSAVGWRKFNIWKALLYVVVLFLTFWVLANLALWAAHLLIPSFDANQAQTNAFTEGAGQHRSLALIALVLLPPIFEETIFRGFIFPGLAKRAGVIWAAILSSVMFGVAHMQPNLVLYTAIFGMLLCFMYVRTKSIIPGMILHMVNNLLAFLYLTSKPS